ncbi:MAG TPA: trypsin-like serine protease [Kofleriaceae bacterium]|nr:trypsin-like serine protease [Kofleriaceae bacterium]
MTTHRCRCGGAQAEQPDEFDARAAFENLSHKYRELSLAVARYMAEASLDRPARVERAAATAGFITRIVGGKPTDGFPECCLIGHASPGGSHQWFCTGVLVHPRIVLTAGHCNVTPPGERAPTVTTVALNVTSQDALGAPAELIRVRRKYTHPGFIETREVHDITVLVLARDAVTRPVPIATTPELVAAGDVTLVGFGNTDFNSTVGFGLKREVSVRFDSLRTSKDQDLGADETKYGYDSHLEFVAGGGGRDSCNGDSGGPAYIVSNGALKVAGLTSRGTANSIHACGDSGIYTRIDANLEFVKQVAGKSGIDLGL